jgi:hypothetical protein
MRMDKSSNMWSPKGWRFLAKIKNFEKKGV